MVIGDNELLICIPVISQERWFFQQVFCQYPANSNPQELSSVRNDCLQLKLLVEKSRFVGISQSLKQNTDVNYVQGSSGGNFFGNETAGFATETFSSGNFGRKSLPNVITAQSTVVCEGVKKDSLGSAFSSKFSNASSSYYGLFRLEALRQVVSSTPQPFSQGASGRGRGPGRGHGRGPGRVNVAEGFSSISGGEAVDAAFSDVSNMGFASGGFSSTGFGADCQTTSHPSNNKRSGRGVFNGSDYNRGRGARGRRGRGEVSNGQF
uniref:Uncharacterized protein n=1 Tax=Ditylenchus dipsaci TaxID=166011 RepID=A0A915D520_9BILA